MGFTVNPVAAVEPVAAAPLYCLLEETYISKQEMVSTPEILDNNTPHACDKRRAVARAAVLIDLAASTREDDLKIAFAETTLREEIEASMAQLGVKGDKEKESIR